jgi:hypothetical protein
MSVLDRIRGRGRNPGPARVLDCVTTESPTTVRLADGREFMDVDMAIADNDVERMRQGYVCIRCLEPQSEPFPAVCESVLPDGVTRWCNFPMREQQAAEFERQFKGTVLIGSRVNLEDEQAHLDEVTEYENRTGLILPDHVKFPQGPLK